MLVHTLQFRPRGFGLPHKQCHANRLLFKRTQASSTETASKTNEELLAQFWESRGVTSQQHREYLVILGMQDVFDDTSLPAVATDLLGANSFWTAQADEGHAQQVKAVSQRILKLQDILGGSESNFDVVWAVTREPALLLADLDEMTRRLLEMKVATATAGNNIDVLTLVQAQPSLLLRQSGQITSQAVQEVVDAWQHGVSSVGDEEWGTQLAALKAYVGQCGDAHVGNRDGEPADLVRWVAKQRADHKAGSLTAEHQDALTALGFEFCEETAEWMRWFNELKKSEQDSSSTMANGTALWLTNWCSVQRIAARSGVLREDRRQLLDSVSFDWSGADALS